MYRSIVSCLVLLAGSSLAWSGRVDSVVSLPNQPLVSVIKYDAAGNLYVAGSVSAAHPRSQDDADAFIAKLTNDGARILFWTVLSGSQADGVNALALAPDGSILAVGSTASSDFPVTKNAAEKQKTVPGADTTGFFARLDENGTVVYASYLNGSAQLAIPLGITTDASSAAYITGQGFFTSTSGALPAINSPGPAYFTVKLDAAGKQVFATGRIGGYLIVLDRQGFIHVSGSSGGGQLALPVTPGAFQTSIQLHPCGAGTSPPGIGFPCQYQYVAKLDPEAKLIYATWLNGSYGAGPRALFVDGEGNTILAGSTPSSDYPVTPEAFQSASFGTPPPNDNTLTFPFVPAPPYTGYVTKLNADGTALIFSTFLGGSGQDFITGAAVDSEGNIYLSGLSASPDFPSLTGVPGGCRPNYIYPVPFLTRLSEDGSALSATQLAFGLTDPLYSFPITVPDGQGNAAVLSGSSLATLDLLRTTPAFVCAVDAADIAPLTQVTPGQLLTLLGNGIGSAQPTNPKPQNGLIHTSLGDGVSVRFNGVAAPILYSSPNQINVQVPYEIAGQASTRLDIQGTAGAVGSRDFAVTASAPAAFLTGLEYAVCRGSVTNSLLAVAHNADGSRNSCDNPADAGSTVTFFVNAVGLAGGHLSTGALAGSPPAPLNVPVSVSGDAVLVLAQSVPGWANSIWAVKVQINPQETIPGDWLARFTLTIGGVPVGDNLVVWAKAPPNHLDEE